MKSKIAFVIITWNSERYIEKCLKSIKSFKEIEYEIFIVDNGSTDETVNILNKSKNERIHIELLAENLGTTKSRNIAFKKISNDFSYVCVLDSDTIVNEETFKYLIEILENDRKIGIIGPELKDSKGKKQNSGRVIPTPKEKFLKVLPFKIFQEKGERLEKINSSKKIYEVGYLMSACWLIPYNVLKNVGMLDEKIFYAPEDAEYCLRMWLNDYKIVFTNKVSIIHEWQRISRKKIISKINFEHIKGLIYFWKKYKVKDINKINKKVHKEE